jgi:2-keto-4-pentenoate hydratase/2-oxohepta-3-ene-1,7-dioic acid hydratase in catechol pathway
MVYTVGDTLSLISHTFILRSGDLLVTGTPSGGGCARPRRGHCTPATSSRSRSRLGILRNPVVADNARMRPA